MITTEKLKCAMSNVKLSSEPHKMIVEGCITKIGAASSGSPCGANGKRVVFTAEAAEKHLESFVGMPLNCVYDDGEVMTDHGEMNIGYCRKAWASGDDLMGEFVVWKENFPDESRIIIDGMDSMGFSVEWYITASHEDDDTIYIDDFEGCGCAILWKDRAAFDSTYVSKIAARSDVKMTDKEKQEFVELINASIDGKLEEIKASIEEVKASKESIEASIEELKAKPVEMPEEIKASIDELKASIEDVKSKSDADIAELKSQKIQASAVPPAPKAVQHVEESPLVKPVDAKTEIEKINASAMSTMEKLKAITKLRAKKG